MNSIKILFLFIFLFLFIGIINAGVRGVVIGETSTTSTISIITNGTDTNASTECSGDEVLLGNSSCYDIDNIVASGSGDITGVFGDAYITNGSAGGTVQLVFNETRLNETIDERGGTDTDTHVKGDGDYLYNDSDTMYFNGTKLNLTIDARGAGDTHWVINETHFINNSNTLELNRTFFDTIYVLVSNLVSLVGNWSADKDDYLTDVETNARIIGNISSDTNETERVDAIIGKNCTGTDKFSGWYGNGTPICTEDVDTTISNCSGDGDCTNIIYYSNESNLQVDTSNSTTWWNNLSQVNGTQITTTGGVLTILESWLTTFINGFGFYNSESNLTTLLDDDYVDVDGDTMSGDLNISQANLYVSGNYSICLNQDCSANITNNGTHTIWY